MSLSYLKKVFEAIGSLDSISVQLLRVTNNKDGTHYYAREIEIQPEEELTDFITSICKKYTKDLTQDQSVDDYKGDIVKGTIYKLPISDELISDYYQSLDTTAANPSTEGDVVMREWNALLIRGKITVDDEEQEVKLISMKSPITVLTNKYIGLGKGNFKRIKDPILTLDKNLDAVIINETFYMLTMQAENLFNMERSYKLRCGAKVEEVVKLDILSNADAFKTFATKGQNPRRFVSFNQSRLDAIKNTNSRKKYMKMFKIEMKDGMIDTEDAKSSERLVKFLCDRAMLDPIDEGPREVSAAKAWS